MTRQDLIDRAKAIIKEAYEEAADLVVLYIEKHPSEQLKPLCREIDPENWVALESRVRRAKARKAALEADSSASPALDRRRVRDAKSTLRRPEGRKQVLAELSADELDEVAQEITDVAVGRARARRAEADTLPAPTVGDLMDKGDPFNPAEHWADTLIIGVNRKVRELAKHVERAGGLLFGTMPPEEALGYLGESERLIADLRAAAQEQAQEKVVALRCIR